MYSKEKVDKFYPNASIYQAMEVWSLPKHKKDQIQSICAEGKYFGQVKKDGNWYAFNKVDDITSYLFSRGTSVKTGLPVENSKNVPHIVEALQNLPNDTVVLGEIYYPGQTSNEVRSIMGSGFQKAITRQKERGLIHFYLYDIIRLNGVDLTNLGAYDRYLKLVEVINQYSLLDYEFIEYAKAVEEDLYEFLVNTMASGEEGIVLKLRTAVYTEGKRPAWSSIKWKKEDTVDLVCIGFEDATMNYTGSELETWQYWFNVDSEERMNGLYYNEYGENSDGMIIPITKPYYYNWKTGMRLGAYDIEGKMQYVATVSSGLNDELREKFRDSQAEYIGKVVEIQCMELTKDSIRHPIFLGFRNDKDASSCKIKDIFK
jgi:ATP-dependent DNA ligase